MVSSSKSWWRNDRSQLLQQAKALLPMRRSLVNMKVRPAQGTSLRPLTTVFVAIVLYTTKIILRIILNNEFGNAVISVQVKWVFWAILNSSY
jgi:hypothetical protein